MRLAMRAIDAQARTIEGGATAAVSTETPPAPLGQRSRIGSLVEAGKFITLVEIVPPHGIDCSREIEGAMLLAQFGVHAINVPDSTRASARMAAQSLCIQIQQHTGIETILALHLPRPEHFLHPVRPAGSLFHRAAQYSLPHRRPAKAG